MESSHFLPASQPITSTPSFLFPQFIQGSSSLEAPLSSQICLQNATNVLDLNLPPNALNILAQGQASGRLPALFNGPAGQPIRTAKMIAAAKRTRARSHSQPNVWKSGSAPAHALGVPIPKLASQSLEVTQSQPAPIKARARRVARAARSRARETTPVASHQQAITTPSWGDGGLGASQHTYNSTSAAPVAAPQGEAPPPTASAGPYAAAGPSAASWGGRGEGMPMPDLQSFSWETATATGISRHCGLDSLPISLIEQVLPRFRAFLRESSRTAGTNSGKTRTAQNPAPVASNAPMPHQNPCPPSVEVPEPMPVAQLLGAFSQPGHPVMSPSMEQPEGALTTEVQSSAPTGVVPSSGSTTDVPDWSSILDCFTWAPETEPLTTEEPRVEPLSEPRQPPARTLTYEELGALLQEQDAVMLEQTMEEPSAAMEFLLDLEHSRASEPSEAGWVDYPWATPTHGDIEGSLCPLPSDPGSSAGLGQGAGIGGVGPNAFDFGRLLDGREDWAELGGPGQI